MNSGSVARSPNSATSPSRDAALLNETRDLAADVEVYRLIVQMALAELARLRRLPPPEQP